VFDIENILSPGTADVKQTNQIKREWGVGSGEWYLKGRWERGEVRDG
jgi:hypothetical protein